MFLSMFLLLILRQEKMCIRRNNTYYNNIELHKNAMGHIEQILEAISHETTVVCLPTSNL